MARAAVERRKASGLPSIARFRARALAGGDAYRCGADIGWMRLSALPSPLYEPGANLKELCCCGGMQTSDAECAARTILLIRPREAWEGDHAKRGGGGARLR